MTDLADLGAAEKFLREHANMLFYYATADRGRKREPHGEPLQVTVVTGYHKTTHWGMMVLNRKTRFASGGLSVEFPLPPARMEATGGYGFSSTVGNFPGATSMRRGPDKPGPRNQSVFVRGFHIMSRKFVFGIKSRQATWQLDSIEFEPLETYSLPVDPFGTSSSAAAFPHTQFGVHQTSTPTLTADVLTDLDPIIRRFQKMARKKARRDFTLDDLISPMAAGNSEENSVCSILFSDSVMLSNNAHDILQ